MTATPELPADLEAEPKASDSDTVAASRVLSLDVDSAGGYAVPFQLDGKKRPKKR